MRNGIQIEHLSIPISEVAFGTMSLDISVASERLIQNAIAQGITYFDTADLYDKGENEALVGRAIKGLRQEVVVSSKVGNVWRPDGSTWDWKPTKAYILQAIDCSLQRLQTDYLDLYYLHGGTLEDPIDDIIEAFERLVEAGKIKAYGLSSIRPNTVRAYTEKGRFSALMTQYSYLDRRGEESILNYALEKRIPVMARGVLAQGVLNGKPAQSVLGYSTNEVEDRVKKLRNANQNSDALAYVLKHRAVGAAVVGIRTQEQLNSALGLNRVISMERYHELRTAFDANRYTDHL